MNFYFTTKSANPAEQMSCTNTMPLIYSNGMALWVPPCHLSAYCNITLEEHPLGEQSCKLKFGSWVYDGLIMNIQLDGVGVKKKSKAKDIFINNSMFFFQKPKADISHFLGNKWEITKNTATRKDTYYPCCAEPYTNLNYNLSFKRKTNRYACEKAWTEFSENVQIINQTFNWANKS